MSASPDRLSLDRLPRPDYAFNLLGIIAGCIAAMTLLPADYYEPGRIRLSAVCLAAGLLAGPIVRSSTDIRIWLRTETVMMVGLVYWLLTEPLFPNYRAYELTRPGVLRAFAYIALFAGGIQVGSWLSVLRSPKDRPPISGDFSTEWLFGALMICSGLGLMAKFIPCGFSPVCVIGDLYGSRGGGVGHRGVLGDSSAFTYHLQYFGYLSLPLTVALHHRIGRIDWRVILGFVLGFLLLLFLVKGGGRRLVGMVVGASLLTWLLLQPRLGLKQFAVAGASGLLLLMLMEIMLTFRKAGSGVIGSFLTGRALDDEPFGDGIRVDNNFRSLVKTLDLIPEFESHTGWKAIIYWAVRPIPRVLWPDKPINPGINIPYKLHERWGDGFTLTISAIGDWYISFGTAAILVASVSTGFVAALVVDTWFRPSIRHKVLYSLALMCLFIGERSYLELIVMSYPILALLLVERLTVRRGVSAVTTPSG